MREQSAGKPGKPVLLCDIDGVLADSSPACYEMLGRATAGRVRLRREDHICYDLHACRDAAGAACTVAEWDRAHALFLDYKVCYGLPEMPGAFAALRRLVAHYDLHVATSRPALGWHGTVAWLDDRLRDLPYSLHFVRHREKHLIGGVAVAVEDDYEQAVLFGRAGVDCFLMAHPWNRRPPRPGLAWVPDWDVLHQALMAVVRPVEETSS